MYGKHQVFASSVQTYAERILYALNCDSRSFMEIFFCLVGRFIFLRCTTCIIWWKRKLLIISVHCDRW